MSAGRSLAELTAEDFRRVQGSQFEVTPLAGGAEASSFEAGLAEVSEHSHRAPCGFRTPFSVVFHGPLQPAMPQGTYRIEHPLLGTLELFLVPLGPDIPPELGQAPTALRYEAVFG